MRYFKNLFHLVLHLFDKQPEDVMGLYEWFTRAPPIEEFEPGWWLLKWEAIKGATFNFYLLPHKNPFTRNRISGMWVSPFSIARIYTAHAHGWARSFRKCHFEICLMKWDVCFWIAWRFHVMEKGPGDGGQPFPLDLSLVPINAKRAFRMPPGAFKQEFDNIRTVQDMQKRRAEKRNPMPIKNYTTSIDSLKSIGEIEQILARAKVNRIVKEFDAEGVSALTFTVESRGGFLAFRLPLRPDSILRMLGEQAGKRESGRLRSRIRPSMVTLEQARRIGWRIIRDWVDAQIALVEIGMVKTEEVFFPYLYDHAKNSTIFQQLETKNFGGYLEAPGK